MTYEQHAQFMQYFSINPTFEQQSPLAILEQVQRLSEIL